MLKGHLDPGLLRRVLRRESDDGRQYSNFVVLSDIWLYPLQSDRVNAKLHHVR